MRRLATFSADCFGQIYVGLLLNRWFNYVGTNSDHLVTGSHVHVRWRPNNILRGGIGQSRPRIMLDSFILSNGDQRKRNDSQKAVSFN